ncbi:MATE family efflux transporter [Aurantivibrio infirmus]
MLDSEPSYSYLLQKSWPIILANSAVPLLGLTDTFIIGNFGKVEEIGAIALGATIFAILYWSFGFLRMSTTGFVAQAFGKNDHNEIRATFARSLLVAFTIGISIIILQTLINFLIGVGLSASEEVKKVTSDYFLIRVWGAPATLGMFVVTGVLIGLGKSRLLLTIQLFLNGLNIFLDIVFVVGFKWGVEGIAVGTVISEWSALIFAFILLLPLMSKQRKPNEEFWPTLLIFNRKKIKRTIGANFDIFIRTLLLVLSFYWFNNESSKFSDEILAANFILLQLITFSAFFLDGYAFVAESLIGKAVGLKNKALFITTIRKTSFLALGTAIALASIIYMFGNNFIELLTDIDIVRDFARSSLIFAALYILLSCGAFQLDGIFIGATASKSMRNASIASFAILMTTWMILRADFNNQLLWITFIIYLLARAITLLYYFPRLLTQFKR